MSVFEGREYYKPFEYPWAFEAYDQQQKMHWLPSEVPLHEDVNDWNSKMSEPEKNLVKQILTFFTQGDVDIAQAYMDVYIPMFKKPEVRMMLSAIATSEANHAHSYSLLNDTIGMDDREYKAFQEYKEMADKHNYLWESKGGNDNQKVIRDMAVFSAFGEGLQLFGSFIMLLNFQRFGKMKGMGQIVAWSIRDENHHVENMLKLFHTILDEQPELWNDDFKKSLYDICRDMVTLEEKFIDLAFNQGPVEGLTADDVKKYIHYMADRRLLQLGLKPNYGVKENPLDWVDYVVNGQAHENFFETRSTEYAKGAVQGNWSDAF
jgi:ribonucleoside-diphosphate reductase beta chain|tara:strand:- start:858 stop:1817 length:960 start_codon:yes stop_codon:yes gene_type:complete